MAKCRECGEEMRNGKCADCAPAVEPLATLDAPPNAFGSLAAVIRSWQAADKPWPAQLPRDPMQAAKRWLEIQQPRTKHESARRVPVAGGQKTRWVDPYIDRVKAMFWQFCGSSCDDILRDFVVAAAEEKIWWRGDSMDFFGRVVAETYEFRENPEQYRRTAAARARAVLRGVAGRMQGAA